MTGTPSAAAKANKYHYFVDDRKYEADSSTTTGAQIKAALPDFDPNYQLVMEGRGSDADKVIADGDSVDLTHSPRFYTVPPANFG
jgi:hypothetical protein